MQDWEKFAAFGEIGELERVCDLFQMAANEKCGSLDDLAGGNSHLITKLNNQDRCSADLLENERPGLYQKTWIAQLFRSLYVRLDELAEKPYLLPSELPGLLLDFHKVLIAAHDIYDPSHRATLLSKAMLDGVAAGEEKAKAARSRQARDAARNGYLMPKR